MNTFERADITNAASLAVRLVFFLALSGHGGTGYEKPEDAPAR